MKAHTSPALTHALLALPSAAAVLAATASAQTVAFEPFRTISAFERPVDVVSAVGDLTGDGIPDLLFVGTTPGIRSLYVANGAGGRVFEPAALVLEADLAAFEPEVGDLDGDGDVDVVVQDRLGALIALRNDGTGALSAPGAPSAPVDHLISLADADADGDLDAFARSTAGDVAVGSFDPAAWTFQVASTGIQRTLVRAVDLDGDSRAELLTADLDLALHPAFAGGYGPANVLTTYPSATSGVPIEVVVDRLDGDAFLDLVLVGAPSAPVVAYVGDGALGFTPTDLVTSIVADPPTGARRLLDANGDGALDLVYSARLGGSPFLDVAHVSLGISFLPFQAGTPTGPPFSDAFAASAAFQPQSGYVDVDGDGATDYLEGAAVRYGPFSGTPLAFDDPVDLFNDDDLDSGRDKPRALDVDGDGRTDLVSIRIGGSDLVWQRSEGAFRFGGPRPLGAPDDVVLDVESGAWEAGGPDALAVIREAAGVRELVVWRSGSGAGLEPAPPVPTTAARVLGIVDLDGDGRSEIATDSGFHVLSAAGDPGPVVAVPSFDVGDDVVRFADLDGDGDIDLALHDPVLPSTLVRIENDSASGTFGAPVAIFNIGRPPVFLDVDGNGALDLVSARFGEVSYRPGLGGFAFGRTIVLGGFTGTGPTPPVDVIPVDIDLDGDTDLALSPFFPAALEGQAIWLNEPGLPMSSSFVSVFSKTLIESDGGFADLDGDGDLDAFDISAFEALVVAENRLVPRTGTPFCEQPSANSSGGFGRLDAYGVPSAGGAPLRLVASSLPENTFGFFLGAAAQTAPVALSNSVGALCLGPSIGRYARPSEIGATGIAGSIELLVAPDDLRTSAATASASAGLTWSFQAWHRDSGGAFGASNLTSGLTVTYE
ncbi:MAG: VCBS repeat-containing protein [Planctomycetota bacterium]